MKHPDDFRTSFTELNQNKQTLIICISYENDKRVQWLRFYLPKQNNKIQLITYFQSTSSLERLQFNFVPQIPKMINKI